MRERARNGLWLAAALEGILPVAAFVATLGRQLDRAGTLLLLALFVPSSMLVYAGVLVMRGQRAFKWVAVLPMMLLLIKFPVGTIAVFRLSSRISEVEPYLD
jgi:hypothetical protein